MSKCKRWVFTSFNIECPPVFDDGEIEYLVYGREIAPDTSRPHLQGYVVFKNRKTFAFVKKWIPAAHFERARGTPAESSDYCKKDKDFTEFGILPTTTGRIDKFSDVLAKASVGDIDGIKADYPGIYLRYKANIHSSIKFSTDQLESSCGVWICGPPRCGKDFAVRKFGNLYFKNLNKWWDGYRDERHVLLSDVEPGHASWLGYYLKIWADVYPFNAEIKGGSMLIRPSKLFVTSNFKPEDCFAAEILAAILARFTIYDFFGEHPVVVRRQAPEVRLAVYDCLLQHEEVQLPQEVSSTSSSVSSPSEVCLSPETSSGSPPSKYRKISCESSVC